MKNNQSAAPAADVEGLTDEQIQEAATEAVRAGSLSWLGFERDSDGKFTVPVLSKCHFQFARAIEREVLATRPSVDLSGLTNHDIARVIFKHLRPSPFAEADWDRGAVLGAGNAVRSKFISAAKDVRALLATKAAEAVQPTGQPPIGRLMDEFSSLPFLWGLNEPGALVRHSDVFKMLVAAGKTYLAAPTLASAPQADEQSSMAGAPQERAAVPLVLTSEHRATLEQIAGWLNSSARIVQNGPDDYGLATQFDYELGQAAAEIGAILAAMPAAPVAQKGEQSAREDIADLSEFTDRSIREYADFREDLERLSVEQNRKQLKIIRKEIYNTVDARVRNAVKAALAVPASIQPTPSDSGRVDTAEFRERFKYMLWDEYTELVAHIESLIEARIADLMKDAERLDFVLNNTAWICQIDPTMCQLMTQDEDEEYIVLSGEGEAFRTPREAIDAAMASHSPASGSKENDHG